MPLEISSLKSFLLISFIIISFFRFKFLLNLNRRVVAQWRLERQAQGHEPCILPLEDRALIIYKTQIAVPTGRKHRYLQERRDMKNL